MRATIIDGTEVAGAIRRECRIRTDKLRSCGMTPGLAVIMVGDDPASSVYIPKKIQECADVGKASRTHHFPADASQTEVMAHIAELSSDPTVHRILVQLPLLPQFDIKMILSAIPRQKDVDGFHLYKVGGLVIGETVFPPCTPYGVMRPLNHAGVEVAGRNAALVGASNTVGKPMALMLMQRDATVSVCRA